MSRAAASEPGEQTTNLNRRENRSESLASPTQKRVAFVAHVTKITLWIVAFFYLYGAVVHVLNIFSLTGFDWLSAPFKWQALDVVYLILDLTVFIGLARRWKVSVIAFYLAATTQILLYTAFRQ